MSPLKSNLPYQDCFRIYDSQAAIIGANSPYTTETPCAWAKVAITGVWPAGAQPPKGIILILTEEVRGTNRLRTHDLYPRRTGNCHCLAGNHLQFASLASSPPRTQCGSRIPSLVCLGFAEFVIQHQIRRRQLARAHKILHNNRLLNRMNAHACTYATVSRPVMP